MKTKEFLATDTLRASALIERNHREEIRELRKQLRNAGKIHQNMEGVLYDIYERNTKLREAGTALCKKLTAISSDPQYQGVWKLAFSHGLRYYTGPNWAEELNALEKLIATGKEGKK